MLANGIRVDSESVLQTGISRRGSDIPRAAAQRRHDQLKIVAQPLGKYHVILRVRHNQHTVAGVQINRSV